MTGALILVTTEVGTMKSIHEEIKNLDKVEETEMLTGPYDIMAVARAEEMTEITNTLIGEIRGLKGVEETTTNIFIE